MCPPTIGSYPVRHTAEAHRRCITARGPTGCHTHHQHQLARMWGHTYTTPSHHCSHHTPACTLTQTILPRHTTPETHQHAEIKCTPIISQQNHNHSHKGPCMLNTPSEDYIIDTYITRFTIGGLEPSHVDTHNDVTHGRMIQHVHTSTIAHFQASDTTRAFEDIVAQSHIITHSSPLHLGLSKGPQGKIAKVLLIVNERQKGVHRHTWHSNSPKRITRHHPTHPLHILQCFTHTFVAPANTPVPPPTLHTHPISVCVYTHRHTAGTHTPGPPHTEA